jgi:hypothetical protein
VSDDGHPNDPFRGDVVPAGNSTSHGTQSNGPIHSAALTSSVVSSSATAIEFPGEAFVWPDNTTIKYTERAIPR